MKLSWNKDTSGYHKEIHVQKLSILSNFNVYHKENQVHKAVILTNIVQYSAIIQPTRKHQIFIIYYEHIQEIYEGNSDIKLCQQ